MKTNLLMISTALMLSACGTVDKINPFSGSNDDDSLPYKNASQYRCDDKKSFYLRMHDNGQSAWVIFSDHEVNLKQNVENKQQYINGAITLNLGDEITTLTDGEKAVYSACSASN